MGPGSEPADEKMKEKLGFLLTDARHVIDLMKSTLKKAVKKDGNSRKIVDEIFNPEADLDVLLSMVRGYDNSATMIATFDLVNVAPGGIMAEIMGYHVSTTKGFWDLSRLERVVTYIHELCHHQGGTDYWAWLDGFIVPVFVPVEIGTAYYLQGYAPLDYWTIKEYTYDLFYMNPDTWRTFAHYVLKQAEGKTGKALYPSDLPSRPKTIPGPPQNNHQAPSTPAPPRHNVRYGIYEDPYGNIGTTEDPFTYQDAVSIADSHAGSDDDGGNDAGGSKKKTGKGKSKEKKTPKKSSNKPPADKGKKVATDAGKQSISQIMFKYITGQHKRSKPKK